MSHIAGTLHAVALADFSNSTEFLGDAPTSGAHSTNALPRLMLI
jgi:hypothetical protein